MEVNPLEQLKPEEVFHYFQEIARIPRPSGHEKAISDYLVRFAEEHRLEHYQDQLCNVIMIKEAAPGYETAPPVILQGHMDMVCEKETDCQIDMNRDGLDLYVDGDYLRARGTTLGGDDGIAIAYALAILASDSIRHPRIEFVCTVSEETGMEGATGLDAGVLRGKYLINLDSESESEMLCGCAGGGRVSVELPAELERTDVIERNDSGLYCVTVSITGLTGGHSGTEIDKGRANAVILLAELLSGLSRRLASAEWRLASFGGGTKDNAIPRDAAADLITCSPEKLIKEIDAAAEKIREEHRAADPGLEIMTVQKNAEAGFVFTRAAAENMITMILSIPNGVQEMSRDISGLVETSLNLGIAKTVSDTDSETDAEADSETDSAMNSCIVQIHYSLRSSVAESYKKLAQQVSRIAESHGAETGRQGEYPAWEYRRDSKLREVMLPVYREVFGREAGVTVIHAGVECGILADKIPGLDAVSIGPDILDIHTPQERMSISSVQRMYQYLIRVLERFV